MRCSIALVNWRKLIAENKKVTGGTEEEPTSKFSTAYTILFLLIIFDAALTWIIPAVSYDRAMNETVGREIAIAGTYQEVDPNPQGIVDIMLAPAQVFMTLTAMQQTPLMWRC